MESSKVRGGAEVPTAIRKAHGKREKGTSPRSRETAAGNRAPRHRECVRLWVSNKQPGSETQMIRFCHQITDEGGGETLPPRNLELGWAAQTPLGVLSVAKSTESCADPAAKNTE